MIWAKTNRPLDLCRRLKVPSAAWKSKITSHNPMKCILHTHFRLISHGWFFCRSEINTLSAFLARYQRPKRFPDNHIFNKLIYVPSSCQAILSKNRNAMFSSRGSNLHYWTIRKSLSNGENSALSPEHNNASQYQIEKMAQLPTRITTNKCHSVK